MSIYRKLIYKFRTVGSNSALASIPIGQLALNMIVQRFFRLNCEFANSIHFASRYSGRTNFNFDANCPKILTSFAVSGGCYFVAFEGTQLSIGTGTIWSNNVCIQTGNHGLRNRDDYRCSSISIGRNCWLGYGAVILPGVNLGDNITVGANAVVSKSFPSNCVIAGVPARVIRDLDDSDEG